MIFANPEMMSVLSFEAGKVQTLVIENPRFFRYLTMDIYDQINGQDGDSVISEREKPVSFPKAVELIDSLLGFSMNRKSLQTKILAVMEQNAISGEMFAESADVLSHIERFMNSLAVTIDADIEYSKISIPALLKMVGLTIRDDYENQLERFLDYMELTREYDRDKLFIFVNMRSYFEAEELNLFFESVLSHEYHILLIDSNAGERLPLENRLTIDADLCEF